MRCFMPMAAPLLPAALLSSSGTSWFEGAAPWCAPWPAGDFNLALLDELLGERRLKMISCCNELNAG